ncbi:rhamnosyltransferase [Methylophilaceae bacterium]|nr:rhamnosyltransferase [Methylophilaceae bacterium]
MQKVKLPKVAVLIATYNGIKWIDEQLTSILNQRDVDVTVFVSDDSSIDGTVDYLEKCAKKDSRIIILPPQKQGSPAKNFYRLILDVDDSGFDYYALADQDDIWLLDKLHKMVVAAEQHKAAGVSSNSVAFWQDGSRALIDKAQPLKRLDFLFESAGPGCTFLLTPMLLSKVRTVLKENWSIASTVIAHDWLIYATCCGTGWTWYISPVPTVKYRQHPHNALGVNFGYEARVFRLKQITNGWYRKEVQKIAQIVVKVTTNEYVANACKLLLENHGFSNFRILSLISQSRRNKLDRYFLFFAVLFYLY